MNRGGYNTESRYQVVRFDILNETFVDYGKKYLSSTLGNADGETGISDFTQINATSLFTLSGDGASFNVYDLRTLSYRNLNTTFPVTTYSGTCLSSSETPTPRLYVTGGYSNYLPQNYLQILNLDDMLWLDNTPSMSYSREDHGCVVVEDRLWVIGGGVDSVEALNITNVESNGWIVIGNLHCILSDFGITIVDKVIFIVGGWCYYDSQADEKSHVTDIVQTIDTATNSIIVYEDRLPVPTYYMPVVAIDYRIYGFGGRVDSVYYSGFFDSINTWMSLHMFRIFVYTSTCISVELAHQCLFLRATVNSTTESPTSSPSISPTIPTSKFSHVIIDCLRVLIQKCVYSESPRNSPTRTPTSYPTQEPTMEPTDNPTTAQCDLIQLQISNSDAFSAKQMQNDTKLQVAVANITHHAIAEDASEYQIDSDMFTVDFRNVSGALLIEQSLCASTEPNLNTLNTVVSKENDEINAEIKHKLIALFLNGTDSDELVVVIYTSELSIRLNSMCCLMVSDCVLLGS